MAYDDIKITKEPGFTLSIESTFLKKAQDEGQIDRPLPGQIFLVVQNIFTHKDQARRLVMFFRLGACQKLDLF